MQFRVLASVLVFSTCIPSIGAQCDPASSKYYVASVNLESPGHLSLEQQARARLMLIGKCFDDSTFSELLSPIFHFYQSLGYFQAAVYEPHVLRVLDEARHPAPVSLTFDVDEGPQFRVDRVEWWGIEASAIKDQIWELTNIGPDEVFDKSKIQEIVEGVRRLYFSSGYSEARITGKIEVHPPRHILVKFIVEEGALPEAK